MVCGIHVFFTAPLPLNAGTEQVTQGKMNCLISVTGTLKYRLQIYCKFCSVLWAHAPQLVSLMPAYGTVDLFRRGCPATTAKLWLKNKTSTNQCANPSPRACVRVHARGGEGGAPASQTPATGAGGARGCIRVQWSRRTLRTRADVCGDNWASPGSELVHGF